MNELENKYSIDNLLNNNDFVDWVIKEKENKFWDELKSKNQEVALNIDKAREILILLRDKQESLEQDSVQNIWKNIERFNKEQQSKVVSFNLRKSLKWAAILVLAVIFGLLIYKGFNPSSINYQFAQTIGFSHPVLLSSNGQTILLESNSENIIIQQKDNYILFNDSIITNLNNQKNNAKNSLNELIVPAGKKIELLLEDETKVWINAASKLAFPNSFSGKKRKVFLKGEAYFEVAKNTEQPFVVHAPDINVEVLGTHFNVSSYPEDEKIETVLLEGKVAVEKSRRFNMFSKKLILEPNQKASYDKAENEWILTTDLNANDYKAWTEGWLQFSQENLRSVFARLERVYDKEMVFAEGFPQEELISGKLDLNNSLNEVLMALADVAEIEYKLENNRVLIKKKK